MNRIRQGLGRGFRWFVVGIAVLCLGGWAPVDGGEVAAITFLGNEGFLIDSGDVSVVVDGFYRGLRGYAEPTDDQRRVREEAAPPFDRVDVVFATHHHADHFDSGVMTAFLLANPNAVLVTTPMAVGLLRDHGDFPLIADRTRTFYPPEGEPLAVEIAGVEIEIFNLHHGRSRKPLVENLGFVIDLGGLRVLHIGDTESTPEELAALDLSDRGIDVAFVPYWHLLDPSTARSYLEAISATRVVAMHFPVEDAPEGYLEPAKDLGGLIRLVEKAAPGVIIFTGVMEERKIRTGG